MTPLPIDIWSDIACPWCWVGNRHLEAAIAESEVSTRINWRAFELDPVAPREAPEQTDYVERLAKKYGTTRNEAQEMIDRMVEFGRDRDEARRVLSDDDHAEDVRADEQLASRIGATAVPFFVLDNRRAVSGAQPAEVLREAMSRVVGEH